MIQSWKTVGPKYPKERMKWWVKLKTPKISPKSFIYGLMTGIIRKGRAHSLTHSLKLNGKDLWGENPRMSSQLSAMFAWGAGLAAGSQCHQPCSGNLSCLTKVLSNWPGCACSLWKNLSAQFSKMKGFYKQKLGAKSKPKDNGNQEEMCINWIKLGCK